MDLIREKLDITQGSAIALTVLVMNLEKLLQLLFIFLIFWYYLFINHSGTRIFNRRSLKDSAVAIRSSLVNQPGCQIFLGWR